MDVPLFYVKQGMTQAHRDTQTKATRKKKKHQQWLMK
jgi:hypothetical protein